MKALRRAAKGAAGLCALALAAFASSCGAYTVIDARGSSSVQPFMAALGRLYADSNPGSGIEISVQAGGSAIGISSVANGQTAMGNASKSPRESVLGDKGLEALWREKGLKTVTLAKDAIGILLLPPQNAPGGWGVDASNVARLYDAFAGYDRVALRDFYLGDPAAIDPGVEIKGFARSGGAGASGTAEAFLKDSNLLPGPLSQRTADALGAGKYGPNTQQTNESNSEAYTNFKANAKRPGAMVYLSLGYILNNADQISRDGFAVLKYSGHDATIQNVADGLYGWTRPFETVVSLNSPKARAVEGFVEWILFTSTLYPDQAAAVDGIYLSEGLIRLTDDQIKQMFLLGESTRDLPLSELVLNHIDLFWTADFGFDPVRFGAT